MRIFFMKIFVPLGLMLLLAETGWGQATSTPTFTEQKLKVAVHAQPPYIIEGKNNTWDGISIQLWRELAEKLQLNYELLKVPADSQQHYLQRGEVDVVLLSNVSANKDSLMDYSHFYHSSHLGVAMSQRNDLKDIASAFFSKRFWQIVLMLSALLLIVGSIIYFIERQSNDDSFGGERSIIKGIGAGFWWAGVTMTTIGYGDKAPVTFLGRAVALFWMLIAMAVTSILTAGLVSAMGGSYSKKLSIPEDLKDMKVAAVTNSAEARYLQEENIEFQAFPNLSEAMKAVASEEPEVVVSSVPLLKYTLDNQKSISLKLQEKQLNPQFYALSVREESMLRELMNPAILEIIKTDQWQKQLQRYIPETSDK